MISKEQPMIFIYLDYKQEKYTLTTGGSKTEPVFC